MVAEIARGKESAGVSNDSWAVTHILALLETVTKEPDAEDCSSGDYSVRSIIGSYVCLVDPTFSMDSLESLRV